MATETEGLFRELKQALQEIEEYGDFEEETEEIRQWTEALQTAVAGDLDFETLSDEEMHAIASTAQEVSLDNDRIRRMREQLQQIRKTATGLQRNVSLTRAVPAAIFRREGKANPDEQKVAQEALESVRRMLDEDDDPQS